jgi:hypothetical protein
VEIVDKWLPSLFSQNDKNKFKVDISRDMKFLHLKKLIGPKESVRYLAKRGLRI